EQDGPGARFAVRTLLKALLPGAPAVLSVVEQAFQCAVHNGAGEWTIDASKSPKTTPGDLLRLAALLDHFLRGLRHLRHEVAGLAQAPEIAAQIIDRKLLEGELCPTQLEAQELQ